MKKEARMELEYRGLMSCENDIRTNFDSILVEVEMTTGLIEEYKQKYDQHLSFSKMFEENKTCLDSLKRNLETENDDNAKAILANVITLLESYVFITKQKYDALSSELSKAKEQVDKYKEELTNQMRETLKMYERLNNEIYKEDTDSVIAASCAKHLYPYDTDHLDLRCAPPICGVVNKFDRPNMNTLGSNASIPDPIDISGASF